MLTDPKKFAEVEQFLTENGTIAAFVAEKGEITGRMMIDWGAAPLGLLGKMDIDANSLIFTGSFDFSNTTCGVAMDGTTGEPRTQVWTEEQRLGAYQLDPKWIKYFTAVLLDAHDEAGWNVPVYAFMTEEGSFEVYTPAQ